MTADEQIRRGLRIAWWLLFPACAVIVLAFVRDRACADRYTLLSAIAARRALAVLIACAFVGAHGWLIAAYATMTVRGDRLLPTRESWFALGRGERSMLLSMLVIVLLDQIPPGLWAAIAGVFEWCSP